MQPHTIILLESTLSLGVPLAWAVRELWLLRREPPRDDRGPPTILLPLAPNIDAAPALRRPVRVLEDA